MNKVCPNCNDTYRGVIHWYKANSSRREFVYRCQSVQEQVVVKNKKRFLKLWKQMRQKQLKHEEIPEQLQAAYKEAKAAFWIATHALNEEFSKYAG